MHIAYVCSHCPAPSHSLVRREVHTLRDLGVSVTTCSVWKAPPDQVLSRADRRDQEQTVVTISDFGRSQVLTLLDEKDWSKVRGVRCGLNPEVFDLRLPTEEPLVRVLCVGRLVHLEGQSLLVEAVARLRSEGLPVDLVLVGDGPKRSELEEQVRRLGLDDHVSFAGAVGQDEILDHYRAASLFCLPSFAEGLPVVLMEAMAVGLPVVTTRIMGVPELVEDGVSGRLVAPGRRALDSADAFRTLEAA